ncbi:MAG: hypothetical protein KatS3mg105_0124 [Gemmatales bacterium]|nr:MAG: hypothetical protein KatS3mg105_0124 [Gemmatales bacterium]
MERLQWLSDQLRIADFRNTSLDAFPASTRRRRLKIARICSEAGVEPERACELVCSYTEMKQGHNTAGLMRRHIQQGFARVALNGDEADLANFLTYGFAELDFQVRPSRQDLVLALFKVLMEVFRELRIPVVAAFDQLEDLLLARRTDDGHRVAEAFFAGIVHTMHQIDGICFLIFAERGLWNRFVPSLDGYIQDRLNNPVHVPGQGSVKALRLEAPPVELVRRVVEARVRPSLEALRDYHLLPPLFPFTAEQVEQIACTEPTLRDMLQQFRHLFDRIVYDGTAASELTDKPAGDKPPEEAPPIRDFPVDRIATPPFTIKSVAIVDAVEPSEKKPFGSQPPAEERGCESPVGTVDVWQQEISLAKQRLEPEGSLTGATRELQAGLGLFLQTCHEHGVKVGPWRLQHVVSEWTFGDHPTYGVLAIGHWTCKDGQPWKVGIGLFLGRGPGKLKDLETKLRAFEAEPPLIDHLILLRPEDDINLTGKSKTLWQEAERNGRHARLEPVSLDDFARLYAFPRILAALGEALPEGQELPNLADELQFRCEKLLEQVCMPVQQ